MSLDRSTALCFATVLDDTVNQLFVLGKILPAQVPDDHPDACSIIKRDIQSVIKNQFTTEGKLEAVLASRAYQIKEKAQVHELKELMSLSLRGMEESMKQSPLTKENFEKLHQDRQFAENILFKTQLQLLMENEFSPLTEAVNNEKQKKLDQQSLIITEGQSRHKVKNLQRELAEVGREKELALQHVNELVAHLKDQLQEMKAKSNMEAKYVKRSAENYVDQGAARCHLAEEKKLDELERVKTKIDTEERCHKEIMAYLMKHQDIMEEKVEFWMEKYDRDIEDKQRELDILIEDKARDLDHLHEMMIRYNETEKLVIFDRIQKEQAKRKADLEQLEMRSTLLIQCWWRSVLTVRQLGPMKKKGKKGKKKK